MTRSNYESLDVLCPEDIHVRLLRPVMRYPLGLILRNLSVQSFRVESRRTYLEQPESPDKVALVESETMVDPSREDEQVPRKNEDTDPSCILRVCPSKYGSERRERREEAGYGPRTSKYPAPSRIYLISSSSCMCSLQHIVSLRFPYAQCARGGEQGNGMGGWDRRT